MAIRCSIIIPVFNRPEELDELLESLQNALSVSENDAEHSIHQKNTEVIVIEDGSSITAGSVCKKYQMSLNLRYELQENAGPAAARNRGAKEAKGEWLLFFDSDCIIPKGYFSALCNDLSSEAFDFFGGPDRASDDFTSLQKAIDYSMTSFWTTGGIRGGKKTMDRFYPRSFNMGVKKKAFQKINGFSDLRFGEDLELSFRLIAAGYRPVLLPDAWVFHKRRNTFRSFFKQVYNSGMARVVLNRLHPGTLKPVHLLPSLFVIYLIVALTFTLFMPADLWPWFWIPIGLMVGILIPDGLFKTKKIMAAITIPPVAWIQLTGYGLGLMHAALLVYLFKKKEARAFETTFYK